VRDGKIQPDMYIAIHIIKISTLKVFKRVPRVHVKTFCFESML